MTLYTSKVIAQWLCLTERRVRQLRDEGVIVEARPGLYELQPTVARYIKYLGGAGKESLNTERMKLTAEKRKAAEMDNDLRRGDLHSTQDIEKGIQTMCLNIRSRFLAMPAKLLLVLTAGVDVQDDRFEVEIVGWGVGKESWGIRYQIEYHQSEDSSSESYNSAYETTSPAANAASAAAGATAGAAVTLTKAPFYYTSVAPKPSCYKSGTFYFYDGILVNNRYRITNTAARCGKLPVGKNVTGWVPASYCNGGGITTK